MIKQKWILIKGQLYWIFLLVLMSGCNLISTPSTPTPVTPPHQVKMTQNFSWQERWRFPIHLLRNNENVRNFIRVEDGIVLIDGHWLKFIHADQGDVQWAVELDGKIDSMVADERRVYVVGKAGLIAEGYNLQTGELTWKSDIDLPGHRGYYLRLQDGHLYAYESFDLVYIFDPQTGQLADRIRISPVGQKPLALLRLENKDWLQSDSNQIMLVRNDEVLWRTDLKGLPQRFPQIYEDMVIVRFKDDRTVFGGLVGLDLTTGQLIWERPGEFFSNFVIIDNLLYVTSKESKILLLDPKSGQTIGLAEFLPDNVVDTLHAVSAITVNESMLYVYFSDSREMIAFEKTND